MRRFGKLVLGLCVAALIVAGLRAAGPALVVNHPQPSDAIIVLAGDENDARYWKALDLLRAGYAPRALVDESASDRIYGRTPAELMEEFIRRSAPGLPVQVCPFSGDSTVRELMTAVPKCVAPLGTRKVLLVTSDYHTRRALAISRKLWPQYSWSAGAADSGLLSERHWWRHRQTLKRVFVEWQKLAWWELVDRHRRH